MDTHEPPVTTTRSEGPVSAAEAPRAVARPNAAALLWVAGAFVGWLVGGAAFAEQHFGADASTIHSLSDAAIAATVGAIYFGLVAVPFTLLVCWPVLARVPGAMYARVAVLVLLLGIALWIPYRHQIEILGALGIAALSVGSAVLFRLSVRSRAVTLGTLVLVLSILAYGLSVYLRVEVG